ncbi:MAG: SPOR domain-containing protein, partial [Pseudomonadota bacterium]
PQAALPTPSVGQLGAVVRPQLRPQSLPSAPATPAAVAVVAAPSSPFDASIAAGTQLAQLGAFDSRAVAEREWQRVSGQFASYMGGKSPVIQATTTNGSTLYRLRVSGFAAAADARRFCGALSAAGGACYPVVMR